jgi:hypothetical protein
MIDAKYPVQIVGGISPEEVWVPADELSEFNRHIIDRVKVTESYPGAKYVGQIEPIISTLVRPYGW